jgi:hypothetical protein
MSDVPCWLIVRIRRDLERSPRFDADLRQRRTEDFCADATPRTWVLSKSRQDASAVPEVARAFLEVWNSEIGQIRSRSYSAVPAPPCSEFLPRRQISGSQLERVHKFHILRKERGLIKNHNNMGRSPEKNGLKLLQALKKEQDLGKTLLTCRPLHQILDELNLTEPDERNQAVDFLVTARAISVVSTGHRRRALPSFEGLQILAARQKETAWTMDRRLQVLLALLAAAVAVAVAIFFGH